jgi:tetratricopeptide (TPR) repeat protein
MKIEEKLRRYKRAFTLAVQIQDVQRQIMALQKMGDAYRQMRDYQKANEVFSQALGLTRDHHLKYQRANVLTTMAFNTLEAHMISPAIYYSRVALHIGKNIGSPLIQEAAWGNLGIAYRILGDLDIAKDCHKKSIDLCNTALRQNPDEHYKLDRAKEKANLAHLYLIKKDLDKALQELEESLHTFETLDASEMIVRNLISLGQVLIEKGDYEKANSHLTRGLRLARQQGDLLSQTDIQCFLAEISFQLNKDEEAIPQLLKAKQLQYRRLSLNAQRNTLATKNSQILQIPTNVEQVSLSARAAIIESNLKVRQGKNAQAKAILIERIRVAEQYRLSGLESMHQISLVTSEIDVYNELINLLIQNGEFIEVFNYIEQVKSRTLLDELRVAMPVLPQNLPDSKQQQAERLLSIIKQSVELSYTDNIATVEDLLSPIPEELTPDNSNLHYQAFLARKELNELLDYIHTDNEYALLHGHALSYQQIQPALPEKTAVVEFFVLEDTIHIFIISQEWKEPKHSVVSMPEKKFKRRYWQHYENEILFRQQTGDMGMRKDSIKHEWLKLGDELLAPIVPFLRNIEIVYFIPHRDLR